MPRASWATARSGASSRPGREAPPPGSTPLRRLKGGHPVNSRGWALGIVVLYKPLAGIRGGIPSRPQAEVLPLKPLHQAQPPSLIGEGGHPVAPEWRHRGSFFLSVSFCLPIPPYRLYQASRVPASLGIVKWLARRQWREANSDYLYCLIGSPLARTTSNTENETSGTKTNQKVKQNARAHRLERTRGAGGNGGAGVRCVLWGKPPPYGFAFFLRPPKLGGPNPSGGAQSYRCIVRG